MSRFFVRRSWLLLVFVLFFLYGCASHQGKEHPGVERVVKTLGTRLGRDDRVFFLGLSGADGREDRLAARVYAYLAPMLVRVCRKNKAAAVAPESLAQILELWRMDLAGIGRHDPGAAFLTGVNIVVRGTVVAEGDEIRVFLRADDIKSGRVVLADSEGWLESRRLPVKARIQPYYGSSPYRAKSGDGRLELWSSSPAYDPGSDMHFFFKVGRKSYVTLFEVNSIGEKRLLYPNTFQPRVRCRPGPAYQVPAAEVPLSLSATGPAGTSRIVAVMTWRPGIEEIGMREQGPGFSETLIQGGMSRVAIRVRIE